MQCPHCETRSIAYDSVRVDNLTRDIRYRCDNVDCGHVFVAQLAIVRTVRSADAILVAAEAEEDRLARLADTDPRTQEPVTLLPALSTLGATTVDHVETAGGQISLVLALAGAKGSFGTGPRANRPLPPLSLP